jgi:hypothetical protein
VVKIVVFIETDQHIIVDWLAVLRILEDPASCLLLELLYYFLMRSIRPRSSWRCHDPFISQESG